MGKEFDNHRDEYEKTFSIESTQGSLDEPKVPLSCKCSVPLWMEIMLSNINCNLKLVYV